MYIRLINFRVNKCSTPNSITSIIYNDNCIYLISLKKYLVDQIENWINLIKYIIIYNYQW